MNKYKQRIAIAEHCGEINVRFTESGICIASTGWNEQTQTHWGSHGVPDYVGDLNAMHEAEKILDRDQRNRYINILDQMMGDYDDPTEHDFQWCCATAEQRAEAFLRTIGKWEDGE